MSQLNIVDKYPAEYASGVFINDRVWAQFSVPISSDTLSYYNFVVNERETYEPVDGTLTIAGISGEMNNAMAIFTPKYAFTRNTSYSVLVTTGIKAKDSDDYLVDDKVWYFTTGSVASPDLIGSENIIIPSGNTNLSITDLNGLDINGPYLTIVETAPAPFSSNIELNVPFIALRFNGIIPSGIDIASHIHLSRRRIFG